MLIGLVGKPSVGKSTFFRAATLGEVEIASYPFTTIKPNRGVGYVRIDCIDKEFNAQCNPKHGFCINNQRFIPVEIMDVAGLVPGASEGRGLGNKFLDDLRQADVFIHVVDVSGKTDPEGKPLPEGENREPAADVEFLEKELDEWYCNVLKKVWKTFAKKTEIEKTKISESITRQFSGLKVGEEDVKDVLRKNDLPEKISRWSDEEITKFASGLRKQSKPMIIAANKSDAENGEKNLNSLKEKFPESVIIPCSADSELALREASRGKLIDYVPGDGNFEIKGELNEKQERALKKIRENVLKKFEAGTGVQSVLNKAVFEILEYVAVFPAGAGKLADGKGNVLPDCFLLPKKSTALDFAYYLHTDFGKNFIRAIDARTKRVIGKEHELKHGDALEIVTG